MPIQEDFFDYMQNPGKTPEGFIYQLLHKYPYFSGAYLLQAHYLYHRQADDFSQQLPYIGIHLPERLKLREIYLGRTAALAEGFPSTERQADANKAAPQPDDTPTENKEVTNRDDFFTRSLPQEVTRTLIKNSGFIPTDIYDPIKDIPRGPEPISETKKKTSNRELIERFIEEQPSISRASSGASFFDPDELAKKSNIDSEELISETLAKIYHAQGNNQKAIKIYEQLRLKFPKKSSYFAAQIQNIINENNQ
ncbi:MAG: tetratricopeptide repeat-containing protein [Bacteroidales bacterium]|nr:tetratricopeptide repeat-containing protein [Bacteroidales bacterium]MDY0284921.1 tetratricopeptide repeat protein [Bacteroidales bacterium]